MAFSSPRHTEGVQSSPRYHLHYKLKQVWGPYHENDAKSSKQLKYDLQYIREQCWNFFSPLCLTYGWAWKYRSICFLQPFLALSEAKASYFLICVPHQINWTSCRHFWQLNMSWWFGVCFSWLCTILLKLLMYLWSLDRLSFLQAPFSILQVRR